MTSASPASVTPRSSSRPPRPASLDERSRTSPGSCHASALVRGTYALRAVPLGLVALPGRVLLGRAGLLAAPGALDGPPHPLRCAGHLDVVDAQRPQRVDDRIDHRGGGGDRAGLADALDAQRVGRPALRP